MAEHAKRPDPTETARVRPSPEVSASVRPFYDSLRDGKLVLAYCAACRRHDLPGVRTCRRCLTHDLRGLTASGRGTVFSFVIFRRALHPAFEVPYAVCVIELDEGPRLVAALTGVDPEAIEIGMPVKAVFGAEAGGDPAIAIRFRRMAAPRTTTQMEETT
jgi:uncharacterized OB-fold protein